ncbi:MAG: EamA family transporter [Anaerolineaceae bacterium]|nr:EamA family transporter [Anaerolineaceae bacterium]MBN2678424.1 EamA family transporter [Anaerolineaceae bacterium]
MDVTGLFFSSSPKRHRNTVLLAFLVTIIWSSSWVLIKFGLTSISPVGFAGLRYALASICLLPFACQRKNRRVI